MVDSDHRVEHGGALTDACRAFGGRPAEWLDLSTGINPNSVPIPAIDEAAWRRLPDAGLMEAASAAAATHYGTAAEVSPLPVAGTQSVIQVLPSLFSGPVAVLGPTYEEYRFRFQSAGIAVDLIGSLDEVGSHHRLLIVVNPNNPDGRVLSRDTLVQVADQLDRQGGHLIVDEAFADVEPGHSVADLAGAQANLVVLRSFGKFFGLAGLRLGFVLAADPIAGRIRAEQGPWAVSGPALDLATRVLEDREAVEAVRQLLQERRQALADVLAGSGLSVAGGTGLFALVFFDGAAALHRRLCQQHILTRKFDHTPHWLRFGLAASGDEDARLARALSEILPDLH